MSCVAAGAIIGTAAAFTFGVEDAAAPDVAGPIMTLAPLVTKFVATVAASAFSDLLSCDRTFNFLPPTPPAALISFTAKSAPFFIEFPYEETFPDNSQLYPTLISFPIFVPVEDAPPPTFPHAAKRTVLAKTSAPKLSLFSIFFSFFENGN